MAFCRRLSVLSSDTKTGPRFCRADAINLATSDRSPFQAFKIENKPIYATQFHPELTMAQNRERFERYIAGYSHPEDPVVEQAIRQSFRPSHETRLLLTKFIDVVFR